LPFGEILGVGLARAENSRYDQNPVVCMNPVKVASLDR
jgi:hypothetical protein